MSNTQLNEDDMILDQILTVLAARIRRASKSEEPIKNYVAAKDKAKAQIERLIRESHKGTENETGTKPYLKETVGKQLPYAGTDSNVPQLSQDECKATPSTTITMPTTLDGDRVQVPCPDNIPGCAVLHFQERGTKGTKEGETLDEVSPLSNELEMAVTLYTAAANNFWVDCGTRHDEDLPSYKKFVEYRKGLDVAIAEDREQYTDAARLDEIDVMLGGYSETALDTDTVTVTIGDIKKRKAQLTNKDSPS